jgi:uncharacterized protein (TIGR02284 family)
MEKEKLIDVLNTLVVINNDRIEGYETASANTDDRDLKILFSKFAQTSQKCRHQLIDEIEKIGGKAEDGTRVTGKFFRAWMDVKSALSGNDRKAILDSCEQGEEKALKTYRSVINEKSGYLTPDQQSMIKTQSDLIKNDQSKIRTMQNAMVEAS